MTHYPINRTPEHLRCFVSHCPAVYELEGGKLLIVGKLPTDSDALDIAWYSPDERADSPRSIHVGGDEGAVIIDRELLHPGSKRQKEALEKVREAISFYVSCKGNVNREDVQGMVYDIERALASTPTSSEEAGTADTGKADASLTPKTGHLDFEAKAREIWHLITETAMKSDVHGVIYDGTKIDDIIASALSEAYEAGRNAERSRVKAAVVCEAFWRHRGVTPDENTQSPDAIVAQDLTYDRRLLEYLCDELAEPIEPLADIQINAVRRQLAAIRKRGS